MSHADRRVSAADKQESRWGLYPRKHEHEDSSCLSAPLSRTNHLQICTHVGRRPSACTPPVLLKIMTKAQIAYLVRIPDPAGEREEEILLPLCTLCAHYDAVLQGLHSACAAVPVEVSLSLDVVNLVPCTFHHPRPLLEIPRHPQHSPQLNCRWQPIACTKVAFNVGLASNMPNFAT